MTTMNDDVNLKITRVDTSDVNPGENGAPDTVKVIAGIASSLQNVTLSQNISVIVQVESGSIRKDYDSALLSARRRAARIFDALAQSLQT